MIKFTLSKPPPTTHPWRYRIMKLLVTIPFMLITGCLAFPLALMIYVWGLACTMDRKITEWIAGALK